VGDELPPQAESAAATIRHAQAPESRVVCRSHITRLYSHNPLSPPNPRRVPPLSSNTRRGARVTCHLQARYRVGREWHAATAVDAGPLGCRLRVGENLRPGTAITVVVGSHHGAKEGGAVEAAGTIVWTRLEGLSYQAGIHFAAEPEGIRELLATLG
jgi:hypothetical protein